LPIVFVMGFAIMVQIAASNTLLQTLVVEDKRGRVMSFYTVAFLGIAPLGSLLTGSLASEIGTAGTFLLGGICCLAGAALFARPLPPHPALSPQRGRG
jgi:MFS family permease